MNRDTLESAKRLLFIALAIDIAVTVPLIFHSFDAADTLRQIRDGFREADRDWITSLDAWDNFSYVKGATVLGVGVALVKWMYACYDYAKDELHLTGFKQERWVTLGWIIPIFNLFKPYPVLNEIYRAGAPNYLSPDGWQKQSGSALLLIWWVLWVITHFLMLAITR